MHRCIYAYSEIVTLPHEPKAHDMYRYPITGDSPQGAFELFKIEFGSGTPLGGLRRQWLLQ